MNDDIRTMLEYAIMAPSGDNMQPWQFAVHENTIDLYLLPERDKSLYNWNQCGSLIAHGAFLKNLTIAADYHGYGYNITLLPEQSNENHTASIALKKGGSETNNLFEYIPKRSTNRTKFKSPPITENEIRSLCSVSSSQFGISIKNNKKTCKLLGSAAAQNERILFRNQELHKSLFRQIAWSFDNPQQKLGLPSNTLGIPPPMMPLFRRMSSFSFTQTMRRIGLTSLIIHTNAQLYGQGAIGAVISPKKQLDRKDFIELGMIFEEVWLKAVSMGLDFQPLMGVLFLDKRLDEEKKFFANDKERDILKKAADSLRSVFNENGKFIHAMFRVGHAHKPPVQSPRLSVEESICSSF